MWVMSWIYWSLRKDVAWIVEKIIKSIIIMMIQSLTDHN